MLRLLRELAANTYLKGNVDLAECKFSVEVCPVLSFLCIRSSSFL